MVLISKSLLISNPSKAQAMVAVNRANLLTRLWRYAPISLLDSEVFFYSAVRNMVQGDPVLFAAGNCYDAFMLVGVGRVWHVGVVSGRGVWAWGRVWHEGVGEDVACGRGRWAWG